MTTTSASWVEERLGASLRATAGEPLHDLVVLGLRRNPRRAHLLVSGVLGKHVPADPRAVHGTAQRLGRLVAAALDGADAVVLGFAETATGLGHGVAETLAAPYLHSTRRRVASAVPLAGFREEHSHAADHLLLPEDPAFLAGGSALVLVDDELSTGRTARNTIAALHALVPHRRYVVATIVDVRSDGDRAAMDDFAAALGAPVEVVALGTGRVSLPDGFAGAALD
ncbi:phosphoribosyltransferase domain-containing protein, partial [Jatrophihabitans endophyticus]|uniref:phosphoribosyltransferase domain-containing protein n=1 Tax=Jatrophihabitans endophyticus TaxID=1206085 RepID=UPI0019EB8D88